MHTIAFLVMAMVVGLYVAVHYNLTSKVVKSSLCEQLSGKLDTRVSVSQVDVDWLNQVILNDFVIYDQQQDTLLYARRAMLAYEFLPLFRQKLVMNTIQLIDFDLRIYRDAISGTPNYMFVIEALAPRQDDNRREIIEDFNVNAIFLRRGRISYDNREVACHKCGFDPNHIVLEGLSANTSVTMKRDSGLRIKLKRLEVREKCGLQIRKCKMDLALDDEGMMVNDLALHFDDSRIEAQQFAIVHHPFDVIRQGNDPDKFLLSLQKLNFDLHPADLMHVMNRPIDFKTPISFQASLNGTTSGITIPDCQLSTHDDQLFIQANAQLSNLAADSIDDLMMHVNIRNSHIAPQWLSSIIRQMTDERFSLSDAQIEQIGNVRFDIDARGRTFSPDLTARFSSESGTAEVRGNAHYDKQDHRFASDLHLDLEQFNLLPIIAPQLQIGELSASSDIKIENRRGGRTFIGISDAEMAYVNYNGYNFHNISIEGTADIDAAASRNKQTLIAGKIKMNDPNGNLDVNGSLTLAREFTDIKLDIGTHRFRPHAMHLTDIPNLDSLAFSGHIKTNLSLTKGEIPVGSIHLDSLLLERDNESYLLESLRLLSMGNVGSVKGSLLELQYMENHDGTRNIKGYLPAAPELAHILRLPVLPREMIDFTCTLDTAFNIAHAEAYMPRIELEGDCYVDAKCNIDGKGGRLAGNFDFDYQTPKIHLRTSLPTSLSFKPLEAIISPFSLYLNNDIYNCRGARLTQLDAESYRLDNFLMESGEQRMQAEGVLSPNSGANMIVRMDQFNLALLTSMLGKGYLDFGGFCTGDFFVTSDSITRLRSDLFTVNDFSYIDTLLGDARFMLDYNLNDSKIHLESKVKSRYDEESVTDIEGDILLGLHDTIDLNFHTHRLPLGFINYWTGDILQDFSGEVTGDIRLFGDGNELNLIGHPRVNGSFTHELLGTRFHFSDVIHMESDSTLTDGVIRLNNVAVDDSRHHFLQLNADIRHFHLGQFRYNIGLRIPESQAGFLVYDHPKQKTGDLYWGQLYATGSCQIHGGDGKHVFNVNLRTADRSTFYLSPSEEDYSDNNSYNFLTFRDKKAVMKENASASIATTYDPIPYTLYKKNDDYTNIVVDMQVTATDRCLVNVLMDPLAEDRLVCRGSGNLSLHYDPRHDITLSGEYNISQGTYTITMKGDLMTKAFQLQNGSSVKFSGQPSKAELNLNAVYNVPSASLRDLDESFSTLASMNRTSVPVDCKLKVTGMISAPQITFDLELKNVSEEVQTLAHNIIGTPEMLNQEVFYLLLFSKFYTPQNATAQSRNGSELTSFASASLTSQLNNLLGHMSDNFTLGTNFRSDKGDFSDMEMDLSLTTRLLNDRLILNGNLGYRDPASRVGLNNNATSFIGDFDAEYLINTSGTLRAKAYSHYNERDYSINNALTTQGLGFVVRRDFRTLRDLWIINNRKKTRNQSK